LTVLLFILLTVCTPAFHCYGQYIENRFTHYTSNDGLPEGDKGAIVQDSAGYIWICTENGLARFDGYSFKVYRYNSADTNSLRENRLVHLFMDSRNRLWVLSFHWLHLYHPDGEWFEHFRLDDANSDMLVRACRERNNKMILATQHRLYEFDEINKKFNLYTPANLTYDGFSSYAKDENNIEWISGNFGLAMYDPTSRTLRLFDSSVFPHLKGENTSCGEIIILQNDNLLVSTYNQGLILFNSKTFRFKHYPVKKMNPFFPVKNAVAERTDCIYKLNDSIILCSVGGGISTLNWHIDSMSCFLPDKYNPASLMEKDTRIRGIFRDRDGIIWVGGRNLEKYDYKDFNFNEITENMVRRCRDSLGIFEELFRTADGEFLMGNHGGKRLYDPGTGVLHNLDEIPYHRTTNFNEDARGNIWCYKAPGIFTFKITKSTITSPKFFQIPYAYHGLHDVKLDGKGRVLAATSAGLVIFDTTSKQFTLLNSNSALQSQLGNSHCLCICPDHNQCSWIGTVRGLNKIENDGFTVVQYNKNKKIGKLLQDCWINDIKEDSKGIIWFATNEHGIGRLDPIKDSLSFFSTEQGLPTCKFENICIDSEDNLWALTFNGNIVLLNTKTLNNKICTPEEGFPHPDNVRTIHYSQYTKSVYILTNNSIIEIKGKIAPYKYNFPSPVITDFAVFDKEKPLASNNKLTLQYNENFINIRFACLQYHNNSQIKYAYKLEGVDKHWVYCNFKRSAPYTNLDPGTYNFYVKAQSPDGIWNTQPTRLTIVVRPPFWQTWWFYMLDALAAAATVFWVIRLYIERRLHKQRLEFEKNQAISDERLRIASDIHDDLGAGLTSIRLLSEIANLKTTADSAAKTEIEKIVKSAENLSDNLKEIIWTMKTEHDRLDDFIIYIRAYANQFFDDTSIVFHFNQPKLIRTDTLPGELRRNLLFCIKEAFNNVVKHAHAKNVSLTIEVYENTLMIQIKDDGVGIDLHKENRYGNGLMTMKKRLEKFGGSMEIRVDKGTLLIFKVPIRKPI